MENKVDMDTLKVLMGNMLNAAKLLRDTTALFKQGVADFIGEPGEAEYEAALAPLGDTDLCEAVFTAGAYFAATDPNMSIITAVFKDVSARRARTDPSFMRNFMIKMIEVKDHITHSCPCRTCQAEPKPASRTLGELLREKLAELL